MTRSVEIPDAAVEDLHARVVNEFRRHGQYSLADARAALVAARPYLMPTREEVWDAIYRAGKDSTSRELEFFEGGAADELTNAVLALLNGAESGSEGSEFICSDSPDGRHNTVSALGGNDEPLGYNHCGYCGTRLDW